MVEHRTENPGVGGSIPPRTTKNKMTMSREIEMPLIGLTTWVSDKATESEIIEAVSEAAVAFCIASEKHDKGIENEIELIKEEEMKRKR